MRKNKGFTLIELMTVIAVAAVLAALAIPSMIAWRENAQLSRAAQDLYSDFQRAKLEAVKSMAGCSLRLIGNTGYTVYVDANRDVAIDAGERVITTRRWSDYGSVRYVANTFTANGICFYPDALPRTNTGAFGAGSVTLRGGQGRQTSVIVSSAGTIRISP